MMRISRPPGTGLFLFLMTLIWLISCRNETKQEIVYDQEVMDTLAALTAERPYVPPDYDTTQWTEITAADGFALEIKYATADNFTGAVIYPCGRFFLRPEVAVALLKANRQLRAQGYMLKLYDGYRPRPAQQKLWDKVPNPDYVASPKEGSMHNRGVAVDLTITNLNGWDMDMGTPYDFFGEKAHHDYMDLSPSILAQRKKLKTLMEAHGFQSIRTEWWHYSFAKGSYPLSDWEWPCPGSKF